MLHQLVCSAAGPDEIEQFFQTIIENEHEGKLIQLVNQKNDRRYTPLHSAIFARNAHVIPVLVKYGADVNAKCHNIPCLHLALNAALLPGGMQFGLECFATLLANGCTAAAKDDRGYSVLHVAAQHNFVEAMALLFEYVEPLELVNWSSKINGITALHCAARADAKEAALMLLELGASADAKTIYGQTPLHIAGQYQAKQAWDIICKHATNTKTTSTIVNAMDVWSRRPCLKSTSPTVSITGIVGNPLCVQHHSCAPSAVHTSTAPPENIHRLMVLTDKQNGCLRGSDLAGHLLWIDNSRLAPMSDILRVHEWPYVRRVQECCESIEEEDAEEEAGIKHLDGDTAVSCKTFAAACAAAGAVCHAIDEIMAGNIRSAFCPIRPPGHHAGPRGLVPGEPGGPDSHGFCILNNVSIGAAYAMNRYRDKVSKVAIVDFDVHHGNGTEETVRWLNPGTDREDIQLNIGGGIFATMHAPRYKPWFDENDAENVMFVSVHGYGPNERGFEAMMPMSAFYPGTGRTAMPIIGERVDATTATTAATVPGTKVANPDAGAIAPDNQSGGDENANGDKDVENYDEEEEGSGGFASEDSSSQSIDHHFKAFTTPHTSSLLKLYSKSNNGGPHHHGSSCSPLILDVGVNLPEINADDPSLELHIAGGKAICELAYRVQWRDYFRKQIFPRLMRFKPDFIVISAGFDAHKKDLINRGYIALIEEDYEWVTANLVRIANSCCNGRVVSALEGGYQLGAEYCSAFAQSVKVHVSAMAHGNANGQERFSEADSQLESSVEQVHLQQLQANREVEMERRDLLRLERIRREDEAVSSAAAAAAVDKGGNNDETIVDASAAPVLEASIDGGVKKRRREKQPVDYAALDKKMREEEEAAAMH